MANGLRCAALRAETVVDLVQPDAVTARLQRRLVHDPALSPRCPQCLALVRVENGHIHAAVVHSTRSGEVHQVKLSTKGHVLASASSARRAQ